MPTPERVHVDGGLDSGSGHLSGQHGPIEWRSSRSLSGGPIWSKPAGARISGGLERAHSE